MFQAEQDESRGGDCCSEPLQAFLDGRTTRSDGALSDDPSPGKRQWAGEQLHPPGRRDCRRIITENDPLPAVAPVPRDVVLPQIHTPVTCSPPLSGLSCLPPYQ